MDNPGMDWRDWEVFCQVVEHGGFSAAARSLGHPKSSLSAAVQRLEGHLGMRLIERTTRHLRLTDAGETIYRRVKPLFTSLHDTRREALAMSSAVTGILRIKSPYEFGAHHAGPVACELMARYPDLSIRIDVEHEIVNPVAEHYDIVFAMLEQPLPSAGIVIRRVFTLERGLFAAPALLDQFGEPNSLADLSRLPLLAGPSDKGWAITPPGGKTEHLAVDKARLVSSNAHIRLQAALAGHGVLRVTASFARAAVKAGSLRRVLPDHVCEPLSVHALLPARQFVPAKVRRFLDALEVHAQGPAALESEPLPG
jgi:DNA-binding transcriptional LysR family regulator